MLNGLPDLLPYLVFITPPVVGCFIGYLTNRIAIRMLFRPLKKWYIGPLKIPMTPGVIPSKRHDLAINIGEMVGDHLLTSEEISKSLRKNAFQEHLYRLIEAKVGSFLKKDLGALTALIPPDYQHYFDIAQKTLSYQIKETVTGYLHSDTCLALLHQAVDNWTDAFLDRELNEILDEEKRIGFYAFLENAVFRAFAEEQFEYRVESLVSAEIGKIISDGGSLQELLPDSMRHLLLDNLRSQSPRLLERAAEIFSEPGIQEKIIVIVTQAIEEFIETLGPISTMVKGFLSEELIQGKIRAYLEENNQDICAVIESREVEIRVAAALTEQASIMLQAPLSDLLKNQNRQLKQICTDISSLIVQIARQRNLGMIFSGLLREGLERSCNNGVKTINQISVELLGAQGADLLKDWIKAEVAALIRSQGNRQVVETSIDTLVSELINKPIGRLDHLIPTGVRTGLYRSLQDMATNMLVTEVPGVVKSINIRKIVSDKIDSFDLLRLERLLLSIMEEQFKYINLFGGLLGFLIGCVNVLFIVGFKL
jgi:uncharacterized membrane protein YheB (UPF0754 family)